jgi:hypothetical protein
VLHIFCESNWTRPNRQNGKSGDYPIVKWNDYEVIAQEEPTLSGCFRVTITINRKRETLLWVEEPINQTKPSCKDADTTIRKYSIEDKSWSRKSVQDDKWSFCLTAGTLWPANQERQ